MGVAGPPDSPRRWTRAGRHHRDHDRGRLLGARHANHTREHGRHGRRVRRVGRSAWNRRARFFPHVAVIPNDATTGEPAPVEVTFENVTGGGTTTMTSTSAGGGGVLRPRRASDWAARRP